jgi:trigger factor
VGSESLVPGLDEQLVAAKVGDILQFGATPPGGEEAISVRVLVKDVKEKVLPELTDEWAGDASEFETVDELREDTRKRLSVVKKLQASLALRDEAIKALIQLVEDEVPQPLVDEEVERRARDLSHRLEHQGASIEQYLQATGTDADQFVEQLRADAVESVKADLALRALAEAEQIDASEEDIDNEVARLAERFGVKPEKLRGDLDRQEALPTVRSDIRKAKALEWLVEHVEVVDDEGHPIDRAELSPQADVLDGTEELDSAEESAE